MIKSTTAFVTNYKLCEYNQSHTLNVGTKYVANVAILIRALVCLLVLFDNP